MSSFTGLANVDWNKIEDSGFKPLPAGIYGAKITKADINDNAAKTGKNIKLELTLVGSKGVKGRKVFDYLAVAHPNEQAVQIALRKLKKLMQFVGKDPNEVKDTSELLNELVGVKLGVEQSDKFGVQNRVLGFEAFTEDLLNKTLEDDNSSF